LALYATARVLSILRGNPIFDVLSPETVDRRRLVPGEPTVLRAPEGAPLGVVLEAFPVPGKTPLYLEAAEAVLDTARIGEDTVGLKLSDEAGRSFFFIPSCAEMTAEIAARLRGAELVFFDGTLWRDDEMIAEGSGSKTGRRMGHISASGAGGAIAAFAPLGVKRKIFIHVNNSNPLLLADSAERAEAAARGWEVAADGMELRL
jgi:pyrroloquinoline quinone biosynthesis protein B